MDINGAFPKKFLSAPDLKGRRVTVTIAGVAMMEVGDDDEGHKPVVKFKGAEKGMVLNKTNASMIAEIAKTTETDEWVGVRIVIYPTKTDYAGKRVDCVRVDYPETAGAPTPAVAAPPPAAAPITSDDIPF